MTPDGPNEKYKTLQASDSVLSVVELEGAGLAASTGAGTVNLFIISAVTLDGPNEKYKALRSSSSVLSLVKLEDGGLAAGTDAGTVDVLIFQP